MSDSAGTITILDNVNLSATSGEALAITGASGSGKSTLLGLMAGLDVPTSGAVHLMGQSLFDLDEEGRAALRARTSRAVGQLEGRERPNRDDEPGQGAKGWQAPIGARRDATAARRRE